VDAAPEPSRPGAVRVALAILALPFVAVVVIPALILLSGGSGWELEPAPGSIATVIGCLALALGFGLFVATVRLFA
jgi:hypothetical protein